MPDNHGGSERDIASLLRRIAELEADIAALRAGGAAAARENPPAHPENKASESKASPGRRAHRPADEQLLRLILESAVGYAIFSMDLAGRVTTWNEGARRILGYEEAEILGNPGSIVFTPEDIEKGCPEAEMATAIAQGRAVDERWHVRKDGSRFWASGLLMPLRDGEVQGFLKILRDRTADRQTEAALRAALDHQQVLAREASHRVKNSLQLVAGLLSFQARAASPEVSEALMQAKGRIATVAQVHDRLWRSDDAGTVDLAAFLEDLCGDLASTWPACDLRRELTALTVSSDLAIPLALIVNELVTNAFKYACPNGVGDVLVRLVSLNGGGLQLEVSDRGPGLPADFDPARNGGSLGMRLISGLARQIDATVEVSPANPGARFTVTIARMPEEPPR